jgi:2-oxoglutarate dehydrogenase E1 component
MENSGDMHVMKSKERLISVYNVLARATLFESFLLSKYESSKLFLCSGAESLLPAVYSIIETCSAMDMSDIVIGMPNRGRLALLSQILKKPARAIFHDFEHEPSTDGFGELKYHFGYSTDLTFTIQDPKTNISKIRSVHLSLVPNSSYPESVDPIVEGKTRAKQHMLRDKTRTKVMSLIIHGDASFSGQGVVFETLSLSNLKAYSTGGTVHIVMNNQIGYTTDPYDSRSCPYPSDVAKIICAPIFHVNGNDPIAVANVCRLAVQFRNLFHTDVVVDVVCYRRYGHDRLDQPSLTQPQMYQIIRQMKTTLELFEENQQVLKQKGHHFLSQEEMDNIKKSILEELENEYQASKTYISQPLDGLERNWSAFKNVTEYNEPSTGLPEQILQEVAEVINYLPPAFTPHPIVEKTIYRRKKMMETGTGIDWGMAELLAYGSLIRQGYTVRLSGQDCERGTYAQRHAAMHDQRTFEKFIPLQQLAPLPSDHKYNLTGVSSDRATFRVSNAPLSSVAVLGFDLGYAMESPSIMVLFEVQFGGFITGAQVIIDQYISSGESKWLRMNGITLLLPHSYGYGEAKVERILQLCSDSSIKMPDLSSQHMHVNMFVAAPTTPANLFHVLRRQMLFKFRKPLFLMIPKRLLSLKECQSSLSELTEGSKFHKLLLDNSISDYSKIERILFCFGEIYYDLVQYRKINAIENIAIIRIEELCPFPYKDVIQLIKRCNSKVEWVWVQYEPENMGAFSYMKDRFKLVLDSLDTVVHKQIRYAGRAPSANISPHTIAQHKKEDEQIFKEAFI